MPDDNATGQQSGESQASTGGSQAATEKGTQQQQQQSEESFIDPASLPEELKPHWKKMHGTFSRKMGEINQAKDKIEAYDRFMSDPEYAKQTILAYAPQLGLTIAQAQAMARQVAGAPGASQAANGNTPSQLVEAVRAQLTPELKWMAESIASAHWAANQMTLAPVMQKFETDTKKRREEEYERYAGELNEKAPGWEDKEDEMDAILDFLKSDNFYHPTYGSKLELLYNVTTGNSLATQEAVNRMSNAARSRSGISNTGAVTQSNVAEKVLKARNDQEAWEIAAEDAVKKVGQRR